jgi:hypothetical protein
MCKVRKIQSRKFKKYPYQVLFHIPKTSLIDSL